MKRFLKRFLVLQVAQENKARQKVRHQRYTQHPKTPKRLRVKHPHPKPNIDGFGSRGRVSNPFILSEAEESGDEDSDSEASLRSKRHSSSDSDSDSDSESGDCFIVDNNCFD